MHGNVPAVILKIRQKSSIINHWKLIISQSCQFNSTVYLTLQYDVNGFAVIENFLTEEEADELRAEGLRVCSDAPEKDRKVFGAHSREQYFLDSATKLHYFYENEALDKDGNLLVDKMVSINKVCIPIVFIPSIVSWSCKAF